jgi:hypothetical protein
MYAKKSLQEQMDKNNKLINKVNKLNLEIVDKNATIEVLIKENKKKDDYLDKIHDDYHAIILKKDDDLHSLTNQHNNEIRKMNDKYKSYLKEIGKEYNNKIIEMKKDYKVIINKLQKEIRESDNQNKHLN